MSASIHDLIAKLEATTDELQEMDALIWSFEDLRPLEDIGYGLVHKRCPDDSIAFDAPPPFTTSTDAIVGLIERLLPDRYWECGRWNGPTYRAVLPANSADMIESFASTPALALCIAFLKATEAGA